MSFKLILKAFILCIFSLNSYSQNTNKLFKDRNFIIIGKVSEIKDSTLLYLYNYEGSKAVDSTLVIDNQFFLRGKFNEPKQFSISNKYVYQNYYTTGNFWVDKDTIKLTGTLKKLEQAVIEGSITESENKKYKALLIPIQHKKDSLNILKRKLQYKDSLARTEVEQAFIKLDEDVRTIQVKFIKQHPNSYVGGELLRLFTLTKQLPKTTIQTLYSGLSQELQKSSIGQHIQDYLRLSKEIRIGDTFIDFTQVDFTGRSVKFSEYKGKYILLEFWSSGCLPCRAENPQMVELYKQYHSQGFEIVGVSLDEDQQRWKNAIEQDKLIWPQLTDLKGAYNQGALIYDIIGLPTNFLIDSTGKVIERDLRRDKLKHKLMKIFDQ